MKNFKKLMALVIAAVMVVGSMNAFAAPGDLTTDAKISITGLTDGDTVNLFKVLEWVDGEGWRATTDFASLVKDAQGTEGANQSAGVQDLVDNVKGTTLSADDLAKIAKAAQGKTPINGTTGTTLSGTTTFEYTANEVGKAGMYIALVTAAKAGTVYNPIVISADFTADNATNTIPASSVINGTSVAKKKEITLEKTEPKITNDDGDVYNYTITTTIPVYSSAFTNQFFTLKDEVSEYLDILHNTTIDGTTYNIVVTDTDTNETIDVTSYLTKNNHDFTIAFPHEYVSALTAAQNIKVEYSAKLNVPKDKLTNVKEEKNDATVTFPNNPNDLTGKKVTALKDGTREYTFTIDGKLFGNSSWDTAELVKVGLDQNNSPIEAVINVSNGSEHAALKGAKFGVYTSKTAAETAAKATGDAQKTGIYSNSVFDGFVTTDELGLMEISGLDVGEYWLIELDAPSGYIKDQKAHKIVITADINGDGKDADGQDAVETGAPITEYYTVDANGNVTWHDTQVADSIAYTYYVPVLNSYSVKIDDKVTSTYDMTLDGPNVSIVTSGDQSTDIANTKGVELPSTGGMGTTLFYAIGAILVLGAGILLVSKRRMSAN